LLRPEATEVGLGHRVPGDWQALTYDKVGFYNGVFWGDPRTLTPSLDWKL